MSVDTWTERRSTEHAEIVQVIVRSTIFLALSALLIGCGFADNVAKKSRSAARRSVARRGLSESGIRAARRT